MNSFRIAVQQPKVVAVEAFDPPVPGPDQVLIQTRVSLVSPGTERAFYLALPNTNASYPLYPGYSNIGEVVAVGDKVETLHAGDRVASGGPHASHIVMDAAKCIRVPDNLDDDSAAFFNLVAIAMQGVRKTHIELGDPVIVIGMGPIGLFAVQLVRANGALPAIAVDMDEGRLALAREVGADAALLSDDALLDRVRELCEAEGANVVIEATGASPAIPLAFQLAAPRGRVSLLGSPRGITDGINFYRDVHRKGLNIIGAHEITRPQQESLPGWWTQRDEHRTALKMLAARRLTAQPLISHRFKWDAFYQAYELLESWDKNALGMVIDWSGAGQ